MSFDNFTKDLQFIDEKAYLEKIIEKDIPLVEEVFGKISQHDEKISIEFRDPTVTLSPRLKIFKRRFIAVAENDVDLNFEKFPLEYDVLHDTRIPSQMKLAFIDSITLNADRTQTALLTFKYRKNNLHLDLTINAQYDTSFDSGRVKITEAEKYYHRLFKKYVYLITIEIDFSKVRLRNKLFEHADLPKDQGLMYMAAALQDNDDDFIPLICDEMNVYKQINDVIEQFNMPLIAYAIVKNRNIHSFWYLLKLGANPGIMLEGENSQDGTTLKTSLIQNMVQLDMYDKLALTLWANPDYEVKDSLGQYPAMIASSKRQNKEISMLTFVTLYRILCGDDNEAINAKSDKAFEDLAKIFG